MEWIPYILVLLLAVLSGYLLWRLAKAPSYADFQQQLKDSKDLEIAYAKLQQRAESLAVQLETQQQELLSSREKEQELALMLKQEQSQFLAQQQRLAEQRQAITEMKSQLQTEFRLLAGEILEEKTNQFDSFNQQSLKRILNPLQEKIQAFEQKVEKTYQDESAERNVLKGVVEQLMKQSVEIRHEANNLARALKGDNKRQGNWGEVILERVLERSGLLKDQEYKLQVALVDEHGRRAQPDAVIFLPDDKHLVVDSKLSLVAYERAVNAENEEERLQYIRQHIQSIENHVKELASKDYQSLYGLHAPDFVLMFIPIESSLSLAVQHSPELFSQAWDRKVVIVSPSTLLATLRTIASVWKQERQNRNVMEIAREAGLLYDKFVNFLGDMEQLEQYLQRASQKHAEALRKLHVGPGNVVRKIEQLRTLGARVSRQIPGKYLEE